MVKILQIAVLSSIFFLSACSDDNAKATTDVPASGINELQIIDVVVGTGKKTVNNHRAAVHYTGWIYDPSAPDKKGKKFDSSYDRNRPFIFSLGNKNVIQGWDEGILGMRIGGKRTLIIPPHMGYGDKGAGSSIPPNSTLIFDVELLKAG